MATACSGNPELLLELRGLLHAHEAVGSFLAEPLLGPTPLDVCALCERAATTRVWLATKSRGKVLRLCNEHYTQLTRG